jgi:hypothetical protein
MLSAVLGQSVRASRMFATVVEQFVRASLISAAEPISEVEQKLDYEVEWELFSLSVWTYEHELDWS